jgi:nitroreductase/ubiquinone/menaquinone biosynthesis C-methylase UbiE
MKELIHEINIRRAKRALSDKKIPDEIIHRLMTAATFAPSCFNNQSWRFLVVTDDGALKKVHDALSGGNYWVKKAPAVIVVATKPGFGCRLSDRRDYALFDCGLATENLMLQGFKEGLYVHAIAGFDPFKIKAAFHIPDEYIVITLVAVGYPGDDASLSEKHREMEHSPRNRKSESEVICYNAWELDESEKTQQDKTEKEHERRFHGDADRLRSAERIASLEVDRVATLSIEGLATPRVLDVGTGTGVFAEAFAARGCTVTGIDTNSGLLQEAGRLVPMAEFRQGAAEAIPYGDGAFEVVFLGHVLHETDDPIGALNEARRVAAVRVVVLEWPYMQEEQGPPLEHRLSPEKVVKMARLAGLEHVEVLKLAHMDFYRMAVA